MFNVDQEAPTETGAVQQLTALIALIVNPKAAQAELDRLTAAAARAREEVTAAGRAQAAAKHEADVATKAKAALADKEVDIARQLAVVDEHRTIVTGLLADVQTREDQLKRRVMTYAGILPPGPLQDMPTFEAIDREAGVGDAHIDNHVPEGEFKIGPLPDQVAGSTISRSVRSRPPRPVHADR